MKIKMEIQNRFADYIVLKEVDINRGEIWEFNPNGEYYEIIGLRDMRNINNTIQVSFIVRKKNPENDEAWTEPLDIMLTEYSVCIAKQWNENLRNNLQE